MTTLWTKRALYLTLAASAALLICSRVHPRSQPITIPQVAGRYSLQDLTGRITTINHLLAASTDGLRMINRPLKVSQGGQKMIPVWCVDCEDREGNSVLETLWNADTGNLMLINHEPLRHSARPEAALNSHEAVQCAWHWMQLLGISRLASKWKLTESPAYLRPSWIVTLSSRNYRVSVTLDHLTHDLGRLTVWDASQSGSPQAELPQNQKSDVEFTASRPTFEG